MFDLEEQRMWRQCRRGSRLRSAIVIQDEHQPYKQHLCRKSYTLPCPNACLGVCRCRSRACWRVSPAFDTPKLRGLYCPRISLKNNALAQPGVAGDEIMRTWDNNANVLE
jgi:hypothetical protein